MNQNNLAVGNGLFGMGAVGLVQNNLPNAFRAVNFAVPNQPQFGVRQPQFVQQPQQWVPQQPQQFNNAPLNLRAMANVGQPQFVQQPQRWVPQQPQFVQQPQQWVPQQPQQIAQQQQQMTVKWVQAITDLRSKIANSNNVIANAGFAATLLKKTSKYVLDNNLSQQELRDLREAINSLCNDPILRFSNGMFSINENDSMEACLDIALEAEATIITLDAKKNGMVNLRSEGALGAGFFNTVHKSKAADGRRIALKPCDAQKISGDRRGFLSKATSMRPFTGNTAGMYRRNMATIAVQQMMSKLGSPNDVVVNACAGTMQAPNGGQAACLVMDRLNGETVRETASDLVVRGQHISLTNEFKRRETWLQIEDIITGQIDRHGQNVMYNSGHSIGIDHDMSFPSTWDRPQLAREIPDKTVDNGWERWSVPGKQFRTFCMPPVIDSDMYNAIMSMDVNELWRNLRECGLTRPEIDGAIKRTRLLKTSATRLMNNGMVIQPSAWATSQRVAIHCNRNNFYAISHIA
ncbi:MAG: hypothetical protein LBJ45_02570 [Holosporaceae bacterium]|jgi:hypothetical protein|nr:hypothetical protein [Holosporaceae bacterium]